MNIALFAALMFPPQPAAATLFRANTPLTKLLETAMRIYAYEYVRAAVGPTVRDICERGLVLEDSPGRDISENRLEALTPFVQSLWDDIYSTSPPVNPISSY